MRLKDWVLFLEDKFGKQTKSRENSWMLLHLHSETCDIVCYTVLTINIHFFPFHLEIKCHGPHVNLSVAWKNCTSVLIFIHVLGDKISPQNIFDCYIYFIKSAVSALDRSSGGVVVKLLACRARGWGSISRRYDFRDWLSPASKSGYGWNIA